MRMEALALMTSGTAGAMHVAGGFGMCEGSEPVSYTHLTLPTNREV